MNKNKRDMTHHAFRNLAATVAVTLLLAASALAQDTETVLHTFSGGSDGGVGGPFLVSDSAGNLYGATFAGTGQFQGTIPTSNDTAGAITGYDVDASGVYHGFLRTP